MCRLKSNECWDKIKPSKWPYLLVQRKKVRKLKTTDISEPLEVQKNRVQRKIQNRVARRTIYEIFDIDDSWCEGNFLTGEADNGSGDSGGESLPRPTFWWEELGLNNGGGGCERTKTFSKGSRAHQKTSQEQLLEALRLD